MALPPLVRVAIEQPDIISRIALLCGDSTSSALALGLSCRALDSPVRDIAYRSLTINVDTHVLEATLAALQDHGEVYAERTEELTLRGVKLADGSYPVLDEQAIAEVLGYFPLVKKVSVERFYWTVSYKRRGECAPTPALPERVHLRIADMYPFGFHDNPYEIHGLFDTFESVTINCTPTDAVSNSTPVRCTLGGIARSVSVHFCVGGQLQYKIPFFSQVQILNLYNFSSAALNWLSDALKEIVHTLTSMSCAINLPLPCNLSPDNFSFLEGTQLSTFTFTTPILLLEKAPKSSRYIGAEAVRYLPDTLSTFRLQLELASGEDSGLQANDIDELVRRLYRVSWKGLRRAFRYSRCDPEVEIVVKNRGEVWNEDSRAAVEGTIHDLARMEDVSVSFQNI